MSKRKKMNIFIDILKVIEKFEPINITKIYMKANLAGGSRNYVNILLDLNLIKKILNQKPNNSKIKLKTSLPKNNYFYLITNEGRDILNNLEKSIKL